MTFEDFTATLSSATPPGGVAPVLLALWYEGRGDWDRAHAVAQDVEGTDGAWVHAYLHRKEGDLGNAGYWYRRAGKPVAAGPLDDEWRALVTAFLDGRV